MKQAPPACFRLFALLLFLLLSVDASRAQFSRLNDLAAQLEKELAARPLLCLARF
jgi:hypothetical protein